jgi:hypothetical protein
MAGDWFPKRTIGSLVDERAERDGAREGLVFAEAGTGRCHSPCPG